MRNSRRSAAPAPAAPQPPPTAAAETAPTPAATVAPTAEPKTTPAATTPTKAVPTADHYGHLPHPSALNRIAMGISVRMYGSAATNWPAPFPLPVSPVIVLFFIAKPLVA